MYENFLSYMINVDHGLYHDPYFSHKIPIFSVFFKGWLPLELKLDFGIGIVKHTFWLELLWKL